MTHLYSITKTSKSEGSISRKVVFADKPYGDCIVFLMGMQAVAKEWYYIEDEEGTIVYYCDDSLVTIVESKVVE